MERDVKDQPTDPQSPDLFSFADSDLPHQVADMDPDSDIPEARFAIGDAVQHRRFGFRGVIFDVDPEFSNTEEWYNSIPLAIRPRRDQPFYHLFAVTADDEEPYVAYVSEQNLKKIKLKTAEDIPHPDISAVFEGQVGGRFSPREKLN